MPFVQGDHKVQALAPHRPDDAFTGRIGHGRPYRGCDDVQPHMPYTLVNCFGENGISVMDEHAVCMVSRDRFTELLYGPLRSGMRRDVDVNESATGEFNHHEHIEHAEGRRDHHTEVTGHDALGVITDE